MSDQAKFLPVKISNLLDNCPMTDCYLQACPIDHEFRHNIVKVAVYLQGNSLVDPQIILIML